MKFTRSVKSAMVAAAVLAVTLISVPQSALATTATANIAVSATVTNTCTFASGGGSLSFGAYTGVLLKATGSINVTCTNFANYTIALDKGVGSGASYASRYMTNGTSTLGYNVYTTAADTTVWGDGTSSTSTVGGTGTGSQQTINVYGAIPAAQNSISGTYTDTITATITY